MDNLIPWGVFYRGNPASSGQVPRGSKFPGHLLSLEVAVQVLWELFSFYEAYFWESGEGSYFLVISHRGWGMSLLPGEELRFLESFHGSYSLGGCLILRGVTSFFGVPIPRRCLSLGYQTAL